MGPRLSPQLSALVQYPTFTTLCGALCWYITGLSTELL